MRQPRLREREVRAIEDNFAVDKEAHALLALINAEFQSDPMSQQCFDARIVERVKLCVAQRADLKKRLPFYMVED